MTVESALGIMAVIDQHGPIVAGILHRKLIESPETFWEEFFSLLNPENAIRELAVELLESGEVTTFADLPSLLRLDDKNAGR